MKRMNKLIAMVFALIFVCCGIASVVAAANETYKIGDVNRNGEIDSLDYILVKRTYFKTFELDEEQRALADINGNGELDSLDYVLLKRIFFGTYAYGATVDEATPDEI